jgi:hypothetical protein
LESYMIKSEKLKLEEKDNITEMNEIKKEKLVF